MRKPHDRPNKLRTVPANKGDTSASRSTRLVTINAVPVEPLVMLAKASIPFERSAGPTAPAILHPEHRLPAATKDLISKQANLTPTLSRT